MHRIAVRLVMLLLLTLPALAQRNAVTITRAEYGSGNNWVDVTERVRSLAADSSRFQVTDQTLGVYSQAPGEKTLRIDIRDREGNSRQISFRQNEYADIAGNLRSSDDRDYRDGRGRGYDRGDLQITSARYGSGSRTTDVTQNLSSRVQNGRLEMQIDSNTLG